MASAATVVQKSGCCNRHDLLNSLPCHDLVESWNIVLVKRIELLPGGFELAMEQVEDFHFRLGWREVSVARNVGTASAHFGLQPDKLQIELQWSAEGLEVTFGDGPL